MNLEGVAAKLADALKMFWQSLDDEERRVTAYLVAYFACSILFALQRQRAVRQRQRLLAELREELELERGTSRV